MRWRLIDRIIGFEPWRSIAGRKAISLEEFSLMAPLGRNGFFPEALALECCVEAGRLLIQASTDFQTSAILTGVDGFAFDHPVAGGRVLEVAARVIDRKADSVQCACELRVESVRMGGGLIALTPAPLRDLANRELSRSYWTELDASSGRA